MCGTGEPVTDPAVAPHARLQVGRTGDHQKSLNFADNYLLKAQNENNDDSGPPRGTPKRRGKTLTPPIIIYFDV
jgi:hypothetical protein